MPSSCSGLCLGPDAAYLFQARSCAPAAPSPNTWHTPAIPPAGFVQSQIGRLPSSILEKACAIYSRTPIGLSSPSLLNPKFLNPTPLKPCPKDLGFGAAEGLGDGVKGSCAPCLQARCRGVESSLLFITSCHPVCKLVELAAATRQLDRESPASSSNINMTYRTPLTATAAQPLWSSIEPLCNHQNSYKNPKAVIRTPLKPLCCKNPFVKPFETRAQTRNPELKP